MARIVVIAPTPRGRPYPAGQVVGYGRVLVDVGVRHHARPMNERRLLALILAAQLATLGLVAVVALRPAATPDDVYNAAATIDTSDTGTSFALDGLSTDLQTVKASLDSIEGSLEAGPGSGFPGASGTVGQQISDIQDRVGSIETEISNLQRTMRSICMEVSNTPFGC